MSLVAAALALAVAAAAAPARHRPAEHGDDYLPVTIGPEYIDLVTQIMAHSGLKPDFEFRQRLTAEGLRVSEMVNRAVKPGGHSSAVLIVREAKDKKRARALAKAALEAEDWADVAPRLAKDTQTVAEHMNAARKNLSYIDRHVRPGYVSVDLIWLQRQLERDLDGAKASLYLARSPRAAKAAPAAP